MTLKAHCSWLFLVGRTFTLDHWNTNFNPDRPIDSWVRTKVAFAHSKKPISVSVHYTGLWIKNASLNRYSYPSNWQITPQTSINFAALVEKTIRPKMNRRSVPISRPTRTNSTRIIPTQNNPQYLFRTTSVSQQTILDRGTARKSQMADEQETTAKLTRSWKLILEKTMYMPKDSDISEAVKVTGDCALENLPRD